MPEFDVFFKELLRIALFRFLALFAPQVAARVDPSHPPEFLDTEFPTPDSRHVVDILARVRLRTGLPGMIHTEVQGQRQAEFPQRMHDYYEDVRRRHSEAAIYSLAVLVYRTRGAPRAGRFAEERDGEVYHWFEYGIIPLADLDARDYVDSQNPLAHGLMGFFRRRGFDAARLRAESFRNVLRLTEGEPVLRHMLLVALERYFVLTPEQRDRFERLVTRGDYEEVREVLTLTEERGMARGRQETLLDQLREKFGDVPEEIEGVVRSLQSAQEIRPYLRRVLLANTLEEMGFPANGHSA